MWPAASPLQSEVKRPGLRVAQSHSRNYLFRTAHDFAIVALDLEPTSIVSCAPIAATFAPRETGANGPLRRRMTRYVLHLDQ